MAKEVSSLYLIENTPKNNLDNYTKAYLLQNNYKYSENNEGYYISLDDEVASFYAISIKQNAEDCYYYILSDVKKDELSKVLLKQMKKSGLKTKKIKNTDLKELFYNDIQNVLVINNSEPQISDIGTIYDFSDEAQAEFNSMIDKYSGLTAKGQKIISKNKNVNEEIGTIFSPLDEISPSTIKIEKVIPVEPLQGVVVHIPAGYIIDATLQSSINSQSVSQNDIITAVLEEDWYYNSSLVAQSGSIFYGRVNDAKKAGYAYSNGEIEITFTEILTPTGVKINLPNNNVKLSAQVNRPVKVAAEVIAGAIGGLATGVLYALISGGDVSRGVIYGASAGGAGGLIHSAVQKGEDVEIPSGTRLQIRFMDALNIVPVY